MNDNTCNGWSNYETWNWKLWLDNDQGTYEYWVERVGEIKSTEYQTDYEWETQYDMRVRHLAEELESDCDNTLDYFSNEESGPFTDILNAGIDRINWREIAENMLSV